MKYLLNILLFSVFGLAISRANITPPPPPFPNINIFNIYSEAAIAVQEHGHGHDRDESKPPAPGWVKHCWTKPGHGGGERICEWIPPPPPPCPQPTKHGTVRLTFSNSFTPANVSYIEKLVIDNPVGHAGIVDFANSNRQLWIGEFSFGENDYLSVKNFNAQSALYIRNDAKTQEALRHIAFEVNGELRKAVLSGTATNCALPGSYYKVVASYEPWTPLPEPSTYGAIFSVSALGLGLASRRKRRRAAALAAGARLEGKSAI